MVNDDVIINVRVQLEQAKKQLKDVSKSVKSSMNDVARAQQNVYNQTQRLNNALGKKPFQGWALSIMFAGMAAKQAFNTIWQTGSKTFNDIMHSVEGTTTGFDALNNSITYLQFVAGQALEPMAQALAPIVDFISELIQDHPTAFAWLFGIGTFLATAVTAGGFLVLAANGFLELATKIGLAKANAEGLVNMDWSKIASGISKAVGVIAIGYSLVAAKDAFDDFKTGKWASGLIDAMAAGALAVGGIKLFKGTGGGALVTLGIALKLIGEGTLFQTATNWFGVLVGLAAGAGAAISRILINAFTPGTSIMSGVGTAFKSYFNKAYGEWTSTTKFIDDSITGAINTVQQPQTQEVQPKQNPWTNAMSGSTVNYTINYTGPIETFEDLLRKSGAKTP